MAAPDRLVEPDYAGGSIVNLACSVLEGFGLEPPSAPCAARFGLGEPLSHARAVVLLVCDALGLRQLETALECGALPRLQALAENSPFGIQQLTSVFPATTTVALPSITSGYPPSRHGVLGMRQWLDRFGALCNMLSFRTIEREARDFSEVDLPPVETVFQRLRAAHIPSFVVSPAEYEGTAFTGLINNGATYLGFQAQSEMSQLLEQSLADTTGSRSFHYLYWPMVDTVAHIYGPLSAAYYRELKFVDLMIEQVAQSCAKAGAALLVVADHGQAALSEEGAIVVGGECARALRHPPGGNRRALYLTERGLGLIQQQPLLQQEDLVMVDAEEAITRGWFGGSEVANRSALGDLIVLAMNDRQLLFDYGDGIGTFAGAHGSLTEDEMLVPLLLLP
jgi:hypothetical protein